MAASTRKNVADILKKHNAKKDFVVGPMGASLEGVEAVSVGNFALDQITGVGGLPLGRSIELFGPPSSGKTTCALQAAASMFKTRPDKRVLYMDYEQAMDRAYAKKLGLDVDDERFLFGQPDTFEEGMNLARELIETGEIGIVIWDSVAGMTPDAILSADTGASTPSALARLMSQSLQQLNALLKNTKTTSIFLNHVMDVMEMGGKPGPKRKSTPGGRALKFYASMRIEFSPIGGVREDVYNELTNATEQQLVAQTVAAKVVKNKVAPPFKSTLLRVGFGKGFIEPWNALQVLVGHKAIMKGDGGYYFFDKTPELVTEDMPRRAESTPRPFIRGEKGVLLYAEQHPEWAHLMVEIAKSKLGSDLVTPPAIDESDPEEEVSPLDELATA